jgi:hypothetical protein
MQVGAALAASLAVLTSALDDPGVDIEDTLRRLGVDARLAVASYVGLSVLIGVDGHSFGFTVLDETFASSDARASIALRDLPISPDNSTELAAVTIILYAARPGAFVDLAADLTYPVRRAGQSTDGIAVDEHVHFATGAARFRRLNDLSTMNQAIGLLIAKADTHEQIDRALRLHTDGSGIDVVDAAAVLDELESGTTATEL